MSPAICAKPTLVPSPCDGDGVALVLRTGDFAAGDQKLALGVLDVGDVAGDGGAVHVHVEDVQENADARGGGVIGAHGDHFAVGGRNGDGSVGDGAIGIAEKVETEGGQQEKRDAERRAGEIPDCGAPALSASA